MANVYLLGGQLNDQGTAPRLVAAEGMPFGLIEVVMGYGGDKAAFGKGGQEGKGVNVNHLPAEAEGLRSESFEGSG